MTIRNALTSAKLPSLEAEVLLATATEKTRTWLLAHEDAPLVAEHRRVFEGYVARRKAGEPLAYITGMKEFYGRTFAVDRHTLIPRPATETLADAAADALTHGWTGVRSADTGIVVVSHAYETKNRSPVTHIVDVGTGSGCIAVTLAHLLPDICVIATDVSGEALRVARRNVQRHGLAGKVTLRQGSLLAPVRSLTHPFLVVSNPPYVPDGYRGDRELEYEPRSALYAGPDGMHVIRQLLAECEAHPLCRGIVLECREDQAATIVSPSAA